MNVKQRYIYNKTIEVGTNGNPHPLPLTLLRTLDEVVEKDGKAYEYNRSLISSEIIEIVDALMKYVMDNRFEFERE